MMHAFDDISAPLPDFNDVTLRRILGDFFANSLNAILITTADKGYPIAYANPAFCRMSGYSLAELRGQSPSLFQGEKTNPRILERLRNDLAAGRSFHGATTNYRKNGEGYPVEWSISAVQDDTGRVTHYVSIQKDLSNMKQIVSRFKETNQHFRAFLRDIDPAVSIADPDTKAGKKRELTRELLDNVRLYNPALRTPDSVALFDEAEFFDCSEDLNGVLGEKMEQEFISAAQYAERHSLPDCDINELQHVLSEIQEQLELMTHSNKQSREMSIVAENLQEAANTIFYMDDFVSISSVLSELATRTASHAGQHQPAFIIDTFIALMQDLKAWLECVFIEKTATNIHQLDASIITSAKQLLMFLR